LPNPGGVYDDMLWYVSCLMRNIEGLVSLCLMWVKIISLARSPHLKRRLYII
jgi:hypothetical protein